MSDVRTNIELATFQNGANRCDSYALTNRTNYTTGNKDVLWHSENPNYKVSRKKL